MLILLVETGGEFCRYNNGRMSYFSIQKKRDLSNSLTELAAV
jgi:hypothetical protein